MHTFGLVVALCAGCGDPQAPRGLRLGVPDPNVDLGTGVGCARFQVVFDAGGAPTIEAIQNTGSCPIGELKLLSDTAGSFDAVTGTLRVAVVMENVGTVAIVPRLKLRFNADSVERFNPQGNPIGGTSDVLGYLPDSSGSVGRIAFWWFDAYLAPSGQPRVLMPGARTVRRWIEFRGTTWAHKVRLKLFATGVEQAAVPLVAPDSVPLRLLTRVFHPQQGLDYYENILLVGFHPGTSLPERTRVIQMVGAFVAGGFSFGSLEGGLYLIKLPSDTSQATLLQAESLLRAQASVKRVERYYSMPIKPTYFKPLDGPGWDRAAWRARGDSVLAPRQYVSSWGAQFVRAPLAWGCSVGDTATHVGIVDNGFPATGTFDLPASYRTARGTNLVGDTLRHGANVLSIVGAVGDNGVGMSGLAWRSSFSVADPTTIDSLGRPAIRPSGGRMVEPHNVLQHMVELARGGAAVINLSLGADTTPLLDLANDSAVAQARRLIGQFTQEMIALPTPPLLVISAGNVPMGDPRGSFFTLIRDSLPGRTLVVAAMKRDSTLHRAPTGNVNIDLVAPGENLGVINNGSVAPLTGASGAAPIVAGVAALVKSFDPGASADSVKALLLAGALRRGIRIGGYPVVDAYEALKLAAERPGAPLCGNRVWAANGTVWKERTAVNGTFTDEALGTVPIGARAWIDVLHGGKRVQNETALGWQSFTWANGLWSPATNITPTSGWGGTWWSSRARDHDGTKQVDMVGSQTGASITFGVRVSSAPFSSGTTVASIGPFPAGTDSSSAVCIQLSPGCTVSVYTIRDTRAFATLAPEGDRAFVAINRRSYVPTVTTWALCPNNGAVQCAEYRNRFDIAAPTQLYEVNLTTGQVMPRWSLPGNNVSNLAMSERNDELIAAEGAFTYDEILQNNGAGQWVPIASTVIQETCTIAYRNVRVPAVTGAVLRNLVVEPANACDRTGAKGGGSMAPRVATPGAIGPLTTTSTKRSPALRRPS